MKLLTKATRFFDRLNEALVVLAAGILLFLVLSISYAVFTRYVLGFTTKGLFQTWEYCVLYLPFLGAAWLLKKDGHVKMDIVLNRLKPKVRTWLNFINFIIIAIICAILTWYSADATIQSYQIGFTLIHEIDVPKFLILMVIPIGSFLLVIQFLRKASGYFRELQTSPGIE